MRSSAATIFFGARAEMNQEKISAAGEIWDAEAREAAFKLPLSVANVADRAGDECAIAQRSFASSERRSIYGIRRLRLSHGSGQLAIHENAAEAQTREAGRF